MVGRTFFTDDPYPDVETAHRFFSGTGTSYDLIVRVCTIGADLWWKSKILEKIPPNSHRIIDQACGTGILTFRIARRFPHSRVMGVELRDEYLAIARQKARRFKLKNVEFILGRAEEVFIKEPVDCITSSYLAKYAELANLVHNAKGMLRQRGTLVFHDFTYPRGRIFPAIWESYFKILQTIGSRLFPSWKTAFDELPGFLHNSRWVPDLLKRLTEDSFSDIRLESLFFGTSAIVTATKF
jgi:demethylmenaquinone methyltransferase/2-methoxy-6-polyprenyl-1,4-benzoquinol methylase